MGPDTFTGTVIAAPANKARDFTSNANVSSRRSIVPLPSAFTNADPIASALTAPTPWVKSTRRVSSAGR